MANVIKAVANALSFAHLNGIPKAPKASAAVEGPKVEADDKGNESEEDRKKREDEEAKKAKAEADAKAAQAAAEEDEDEGGEGDEQKEAKKAKATAYRAGYQAANERAAKVFASAEAAGNIALAAELVFRSDMSADAIIGALSVSAAPRRSSLDARMASLNTPIVGPGDAPPATPGSKQEAAAITVKAILAAGAKARGEKAA